MKKLLLLFSALALFSCTKDPSMSSPEGDSGSGKAKIVGMSDNAVAGVINVKVSPEVAEAIESAANTRAVAQTRSGIDDIDFILNEIGADRFERVFPYDERFEARHRAFGLHCWYTIAFDDEVSLQAVGERLSACPEVSVVEYRFLRRPLSEGPVVPFNSANLSDAPATRASMPMNDPGLSNQWHYHNAGPTSTFSARRAGADIDLFDAWNLCTGSEDIIVAVIDQPVQYTHPDLAANMWTNPKPTKNDIHGYNFWNQTSELDWKTYAYDSQSRTYEYADHGTHVAGTIAAVNNNSVGVCGIAGGNNGGGVKIMSCQTMGYSYANANNNAAEQALIYAADNGAVIAQNSWGYVDSQGNDITESTWNNNAYSSFRTAINYFIASAGSDNPNSPISGGIVIFAAGNSGDVVGDAKTWPGAYAPVIAVSSMGWDYRPAYYTNYGTWTDITAPGGDQLDGLVGSRFYDESMILSTVLQDASIDFKDGRQRNGIGFMQGTSMACPHVSGVAALGLSYAAKIGKKFTPSEFTSLLLSSTNDIDPYLTGTKYFPQYGINLNISDYKNKMGRGYVDAYKLLLAIQGTPVATVQKGVVTNIDLTRYFGGTPGRLSVSNIEISTADRQKLGLASLPTIQNGVMTLTCANIGSGMCSVSANVGGTTVTRKFAIVVRNVAENGGWL